MALKLLKLTVQNTCTIGMTYEAISFSMQNFQNILEFISQTIFSHFRLSA